MRELEVHAAAVNVEVRAEERGRHGGALDVPAGPARAPGRVPRRLAGLGVLPQDEVERIALGFVDLDPRTGPQVGEALAGEPAVAGEARHRVHDIPVGGQVGVILCQQLRHHGDDLRHVLRGARLMIRALDAEPPAILVHGRDEAFGELARRLAILGGAPDDLVVYVGDVAHVGEAVAAMAQIAAHDVEHEQHARVADVHVVVHREAAHVHA